MQDRFKFRVWDNKLNQYRTCGDIQLSANGKTFIISKELPNLCQYIEDVAIEFCTGLKDKNGKLIYEGDIIKQGNSIYKVIFSYDDVASCGCCVPSFSGCGFVMVSVYGSRGDLDNYSELEVIGNIHENADLFRTENE